MVIFHTGYNDKFLNPPANPKAGWPQAANTAMWLDPLNGKSEGWPAPGPDAIVYLKSKGIRCVATDAPDLGGVEPGRALMTYWALGVQRDGRRRVPGQRGADSAARAYFLFAAVKVRDCHGGPGRAIVLH